MKQNGRGCVKVAHCRRVPTSSFSTTQVCGSQLGTEQYQSTILEAREEKHMLWWYFFCLLLDSDDFGVLCVYHWREVDSFAGKILPTPQNNNNNNNKKTNLESIIMKTIIYACLSVAPWIPRVKEIYALANGLKFQSLINMIWLFRHLKKKRHPPPPHPKGKKLL